MSQISIYVGSVSVLLILFFSFFRLLKCFYVHMYVLECVYCMCRNLWMSDSLKLTCGHMLVILILFLLVMGIPWVWYTFWGHVGVQEPRCSCARLIWMTCADTWSRGDLLAHAAANGHVWVYGPISAGVCVNVHGSCCHRLPKATGMPGSGLSSVAILVSGGSAATGVKPVWVVHAADWGMITIRPELKLRAMYDFEFCWQPCSSQGLCWCPWLQLPLMFGWRLESGQLSEFMLVCCHLGPRWHLDLSCSWRPHLGLIWLGIFLSLHWTFGILGCRSLI